MGNLVFQAASGGQVALSGPNTASSFTIAVPAVTGTLVTTGDTATVTSTMISGPLTSAVGGTGVNNGSATLTLAGNVTHSGAFTQTFTATGNTSLTLPTSGTLQTTTGSLASNTGLPLTTGVTGTLPVANGGTNLTSFTANGVVYASSTSALATGSALTFDGTNLALNSTQRLLVGKITSDVNNFGVQVYGTSTYTNGLQVTYGGVGAAAIWVPSASALAFGADGASGTTELMRLTSTGLGIGTSSPADKLEVYSTITARTGSGTSALRLRNTTSDYQWQTVSGTNAVALFDNAVGSARLTLDSSGNLGLGVTPSAWATFKAIQVGGAGSIHSSANGNMRMGSNFYFNGTNYIRTSADYATMYSQNDSSGYHAWFNAASSTAGSTISFTQALTLNADVSLYLGTTSNVNNGGFRFFKDYDATGSSAFEIGHITGSASGNNYALFKYNGTTIGSITQSGTTAVLYNLTSDQRLKENIQDAESSSSLIDAIQVRQFDWKSDGSHTRYGFVAQELVTVAPEAVHQPSDTEEMMAVDYSKLVPMLVKEIQSLRKRLANAGIA